MSSLAVAKFPAPLKVFRETVENHRCLGISISSPRQGFTTNPFAWGTNLESLTGQTVDASTVLEITSILMMDPMDGKGCHIQFVKESLLLDSRCSIEKTRIW